MASQPSHRFLSSLGGYQAGAHSGFKGSSVYLITCCGMCTFGATEPITEANSTAFASTIMEIMMCYGISHTAVLDKDIKFFGVCHEALDLNNINNNNHRYDIYI